MDYQEQRTKAAQQQNPDWAARVVRNLAQIELDWYHAYDYLSGRMMTEAFLVIEKVVKAPWQIVENEWCTQVVCPEWKMARGVGTGDMFLQINEISADVESYEHTWLACVTKTVPSLLCVELAFRRGLQDTAVALLRDDKVASPLWKMGFARDEDSSTLMIPIHIEAETLAQAFEMNELTPAVAPFGKAMAQAIAAKPALDKLLEQVRSAAKHK